MGRNITIDARRGGGAAHEVLIGQVTIEPTMLRNSGDKTVLPDITTEGITNGTATLENVDVSPAGPEPAWAYKVTFQNYETGRTWTELVGVPTGTTAVKYPTLPRFTAAIPPETTKADLQNWVATTEAAKNTAVQAAATATAPTDAMVAGKINDPASLTGTAFNTGLVGSVSEGGVAIPALEETVTRFINTPGTGPSTALSAAIEERRIAPTAFLYESRADLFRVALFQEDSGAVYSSQTVDGNGLPYLDKSSDYGKSWATRGRLPGFLSSLLKLRSGTLLAFEATSLTTLGLNPKVWRSTDDGATWAQVFTTQFPPFTHGTGVVEGSDGSVLISEYGNVNGVQYKIYRSADDGQTFTQVWASSGTEQGGDVGHIHSVTYDPYEGCHVAFVDRPNTSTDGPYWMRSNDNGQTWTTFGLATGADTPNTVRPMFFPNYVAWGTDNERNGRIGRIKRSDFYAGLMTKIEVVATLNGKSMYFTFPLRPGVWLVSASLEAIIPPPGEVVDYAQEAFLVSDDGALVTGAFAYDQPSVTLGTLSASGKVAFPGHYFNALDHKGLTMANLPWGETRSTLMVPLSQGISPSTYQMGSMFGRGSNIIANNLPLRWNLADGNPVDVVTVNALGEVVVSHTGVPLANRPEITMRLSDGRITFKQGGASVAYIDGKKLIAFNTLWIAPNGVAILAGNGNPNGVQTAPVGSLFLNWSETPGPALWTKEIGSGNTGWVPAGVSGGATSFRPTAPTVGQHFGDSTINKLIWWNGTAWVDAMGVAV